jgi:large subunit ribosomal protein L27
MAHKKAGGSAKNLSYSNPKYLGIKLSGGSKAKVGDIILTQRGTKYMPGDNVGLGKDYTIFAMKEGTVEYKDKRKTRYDGHKIVRKQVSVKFK